MAIGQTSEHTHTLTWQGLGCSGNIGDASLHSGALVMTGWELLMLAAGEGCEYSSEA